MFHGPWFITVACLVSYVPATSLETYTVESKCYWRLFVCQQNVKTMYFKTLIPRLLNLDIDLRLGFCVW